jgi:3-hydroxyisobutyrate dehydrogenase
LAEGPDNFHGKTIIQMGTIAPLESIEVQKAIFERGGEYFECPVLGSRNEVKDGQLILMVGSSPQKFAEWKDFLKLLGPQPKHVGEVGKAAALKLALNQLIASYASAYAFSLAFLQKEEIRVEDFLEIIRPSSLYTPMLDKKLPKWLNRDYSNPNFSLKHLLKDVDLILREAHHLKLSTQVVKAIRLQLASALSQGLGESDYSAVLESILHDPHTKYP